MLPVAPTGDAPGADDGSSFALRKIISPEHTALVIIDVQNDFCSPQGFFAQTHDLSLIEAALPRLQRLLVAAHEAGVRVAFCQNVYDEAFVSAPMKERWHRLGWQMPYCISGTWGAEIGPVVTPEPGDRVFVKHRYNLFSNPEFQPWLVDGGITTLVVTGVATNVCVECTVSEGFVRDYFVVVPQDCVATYSPDAQEMALRNIGLYFGIVASSRELIDVWSAYLS